MKKYIIIISVAIAVCVGIFFFFHVPKKQPCATLRDPSGVLSELCSLGGLQSPYQKSILVVHKYFYPNDSCFVSIDTGDVDCKPFPSFFTTGYNQSATTTDLSTLVSPHPPLALDSSEFTNRIQSFVVQNIGQPIEGFSATVYLNAFPGLLKVDFNNVKTLEGIYVYSNGKLNFVRKESNRISTADEMLVEKGHETLLNNIRNRLGNNLSLDEIVKGITAQGIGRVSGTILLGPICPVVKDTPDQKCADKPIFGEFIVQNAMGNVEFTRFGTQGDGSFSVSLPSGEYYITWAEPHGPGVQGRLVNVLAGNTSEYTITFDTGMR